VEGVTGWAIGADADRGDAAQGDVEDLYRKLQHVIAPLFYDDRRLDTDHAPVHRPECVVFQYRSHGASVPSSRVLSNQR
jgi:hypothetical protein